MKRQHRTVVYKINRLDNYVAVFISWMVCARTHRVAYICMSVRNFNQSNTHHKGRRALLVRLFPVTSDRSCVCVTQNSNRIEKF